MANIEWTDDLSVGIPKIDEQHKALIGRLCAVSDAIEAQEGEREIAKTLSFLIDYTETHFSDEETYMKELNYPGLAEQEKKHREFIVTLKDLERDFDEEGSTHGLADAINTLLLNWLTNHIRAIDRKIADFVSNQ